MARSLSVQFCNADTFEEDLLRVDSPFTEEDLKKIASKVDLPNEYWSRMDTGMTVYAANAYDPHEDMYQYFNNVSDYLHDNHIEDPVSAAFSWDYGSYEIYSIDKDSVRFVAEQGYGPGEPLVPEEEMAGAWYLDYEAVPYRNEAGTLISQRIDGNMNVVHSLEDAERKAEMAEQAQLDAVLRGDYEKLCHKNNDSLSVEERTANFKQMAALKKDLIQAEKDFIEKFDSNHDEYNALVSEMNRDHVKEAYQYKDETLFENMYSGDTEANQTDDYER